jgi:acyl dehydratase
VPDRSSQQMMEDMAQADGDLEDLIELGPINVRTDASHVAAFAQALGFPDTFKSVPLTFPIRWLSLPNVRGEALRRLKYDQTTIVHWFQSFEFLRPLERDRDYSLEIAVRRNPSEPSDISLRNVIQDSAGNPLVRLDTGLRKLVLRSGQMTSPRTPVSASESVLRLDFGPVDIGQTRHYAAASLDDNPIHTDIDVARANGLPNVIGHGMMVMGKFELAITGWRRDVQITRLSATFLQPLIAGRSIALTGRIVKLLQREGDEMSILRLVATTDQNEVVCIGEASVRAIAGRTGNRLAS